MVYVYFRYMDIDFFLVVRGGGGGRGGGLGKLWVVPKVRVPLWYP